MRKLFLLFTLLMCFECASQAITGEDLTNYKLKEYNTVEEFRDAYLNKTITYSPIGKYNEVIKGYLLSRQMDLGIQIRDFLVTDIKGKTKKGADTQEMEWTIKEIDGSIIKTFKVHSGNYKKVIYSNDEFLFKDLQFFFLDKWKEDHASEIGKLFEDRLVKAKYEVVNVYLGVDADPDLHDRNLFKKYTVKNSVTGEKKDYIADLAQSLCFKEDLTGYYVTSLSKVEKPSNPSVRYGKTTTVVDKGITKYSYEDNYISIVILGTEEQFNFTIKNVSQNSLKIIWDDAVFVDYTGSTSKIMHNGIKYSEREASQPASTIIKGASLDDLACPTANVYYSDPLKKWMTKSMYPKEIFNKTLQVKLMLPIQIKDVTNEYIFVFDINYKYKYPERLNLP